MVDTTSWDLLIRGATVFDGSGAPPVVEDIAVRNGRIAARGRDLPTNAADSVVEAAGQWLLPGMLDIHTHLDLEVDVAPGLPEVVRHGTTTVLVGNCSLVTCFGTQKVGSQEPIVDCFTRVENIPKPVLRKCSEAINWDNTGDYLNHFEQIALGPNLAAFVPHSMLRVEVMGLEDSVSRDPTDAELEQMAALLEQAMEHQRHLSLRDTREAAMSPYARRPCDSVGMQALAARLREIEVGYILKPSCRCRCPRKYRWNCLRSCLCVLTAVLVLPLSLCVS